MNKRPRTPEKYVGKIILFASLNLSEFAKYFIRRTYLCPDPIPRNNNNSILADLTH
jgi:hypothetical protein